MTTPRVTVLIDTYNHQRFIEEAIISVLAQDFPASKMEILVVDDGSTDRTPEIIRKFQPRVRLIRKENGGQASAFNAGIPEARGEIVAFLDGDDWWAPNKLSRVVEVMTNDPAIGIVGHGIVMCHLNGRDECLTLRKEIDFRANTVDGARLFRLRRAFLGTSRMTIRADLLCKIGPVPDAIAIEADEYLFTLAAVSATARILPEVFTYYRLHESNSFQFDSSDLKRIRNKQRALEALAQGLRHRLESCALDPAARRDLIGIVQAEADQLRLHLYGGKPWETVLTEWSIYRALRDDASALHRVFKILSLLPALALPPKVFYDIRDKIVHDGRYLRARERWLPMPVDSHFERHVRAGS